MSQYTSRDAPITGSSVSDTHHGFWKDYVEREKHINDRWYNEYGRFYYQKPTSKVQYHGPIYFPHPQVKELKYLPDSKVSPSEPMAYLRECLKHENRSDFTMLEQPVNYVAKKCCHGRGLECCDHFSFNPVRQCGTVQEHYAPVQKQPVQKFLIDRNVQPSKAGTGLLSSSNSSAICKGSHSCFVSDNSDGHLLATTGRPTDLGIVVDRNLWPELVSVSHHPELKHWIVPDCMDYFHQPERTKVNTGCQEFHGSKSGSVNACDRNEKTLATYMSGGLKPYIGSSVQKVVGHKYPSGKLRCSGQHSILPASFSQNP